MRNRLASLTVFVVLAGSADVHAQDAVSPPAADPAYLDYVVTDDTATLPDGRRIHLVCMGQGSPTVILTAGMGDWGAAWRKVQKPIAEHTRVCSWDRAGFGFSSASPAVQTPEVTTTDLEAALSGSGIKGPYVMAGHSYGAYESMIFTDRHPDQVVGFVSVDGSFPDQMARMHEGSPVISAFADQMMAAQTDGWKKCVADLEAGRVFIGSPDPDGCLKFPPDYPVEVSAALARLDSDGRRLATQASLMENFGESAAAMANPARTYGDMPLVVLTAGATPTDAPESVLAAWPQQAAVWMRGHDEVAALSTQGVNRLVADSGHYILYERPEIVVSAILEVVEAARAGRQ